MLQKIEATMGIGPMTFSLRERRSATELNRLPILLAAFIFSFHPLILERFHGVGAAYKILVLGPSLRKGTRAHFTVS